MPRTTRFDPDALTPAQRREEIVAILTRAVVRLQQRVALHKLPTATRAGQIGLDSCREMPLSVRGQRHNG